MRVEQAAMGYDFNGASHFDGWEWLMVDGDFYVFFFLNVFFVIRMVDG